MKRTSEQNNYYQSVCRGLSEFFGKEPYNIKISPEEIHTKNKIVFKHETTTNLSVSEFIDFIDKVIAYWQFKTSGEWMPK